jgi:MFS family permease
MSLSSGQPSRSDSAAPDRHNQRYVSQPPLGEQTNWRGVAFGFALSSFVAFQQFKLPPVLPDLLERFHYPLSLAASCMSIYAVVGLVASVPLGLWLKRRRYRPALLLGIASTIMGLVLALAMAKFGLVLLLSRGLEGVTYAIFAIAGPAIATSSARLRDLPLVTGLLAGWIPVGQIGAGLLALAAPSWNLPDWGLVLAGWQVIWLIALALTLLLGLYCWRYPHQNNVGSKGTPAKAAVPVITDTDRADNVPLLGAAVSQTGASASPADHMQASGIISESRPDERKRPVGRGADLLAAGIFLVWSGQYFAFMTWLTQFLIEQHHLQPQQAVLVYLLPVVVLLGFNLLTGWALGQGLKLMPALLISLVLQGLVWALNPILDGTLGIVALLVYGICAGVIPTCLFHLPHHIAAHRHHGGKAGGNAVKAGPEAFATLMTGRNIGVLCGPIMLPQLMVWLGNWNEAALAIAVVTWLGAVMTLGLVRQLR